MVAATLTTAEIQNKYATQQAGVIKTDTATVDSQTKLGSDFKTFLTMLTTQLQNQDPLSPMDSSQFTQQLVSFSGVEQQIAANDKLAQIIGLQQTSGAGTYLGYIGKEVEASGNQLPLTGDTGKFTYTLDNVASDVAIKIYYKNGQLVRTVSGDKKIGKHELSWDGKDNGGTVLPKDTYTISVTAGAADGSSKAAPTTTFGLVSGVETSKNGATLTAGKARIDTANIISIRQPAAATGS
jgi:flagellar basal-body rod modification protein FlgD